MKRRLAFLLVITLAAGLLVSSLAAAGTTWNQVNTGGFGSANNQYTSSMSVFGSYLYVGTGNNVTGCQVWRSSNGTTWNQVNTSGFGSTNNKIAASMSVFGSYLYVGTSNILGCQVWRSSDGTTWNQVNISGFGYGAAEKIAASMSVLGSYLYVGTWSTGGCQVWRTPDGTTWNQVNTNGFGSTSNGIAYSMSVFGSYLYVGTENDSTGCQVWRSSNGTTWNQVNTSGFGPADNNRAASMSVLGSYLYVGTENDSTGCQVWRSSNGTTWNQVNTSGFGSANNAIAAGMSVFGSYLYVGTWNNSGCQVWSTNGTTWNQVNTSGFGSANNVEAASMSVLGSYLYVGTWNNSGCQVWSTNGSPAPGNASSFYFAEGYTGPNFQEYLCLGNPNAAAATANVTYLFSDGTTKAASYNVPATGRYTVNVNTEVGANKEVSIQVQSQTANLVAERPMYFNYNGVWTGGSDAIGATAPNTKWYFAEGNTLPEFDQYVTVLNPGSTSAKLKFHYMVEGQGEKLVTGQVGPHSRKTFKTRDQIGDGKNESLYLESDQPVVAERPMYFNYQGLASNNWTGGHDVVGTNSPAKDWYFAEGTTRKNSTDGAFEQWLCLQNPGTTPLTVTATYQLAVGQGNPVSKTYTVPAQQRLTVPVNKEIGPDKDCSVHLHSTSNFIAERPMYFSYHAYAWTGGHDVLGVNSTATTWFFAEGTTRSNFEEWLCLQNPGNSDAHTTVTYYTTSGQAINKSWTVKANTRLTVSANSDVGANQDISTKVSSDKPIIVERPMYFDYNGWTGGHDVVGFVPQ